MKKFAIVVHGGAGPASDFVKENLEGYKKGIEEAIEAGYKVLEKNGKAVDAVEAAVNSLEDNPLFNAGRGSALNAMAEVEMCASIMDGDKLQSGAAAIVKNVKHPISLAKAIMLNTDYVYLGNQGALEYAKSIDIQLSPDSYFITEHQYDKYAKAREDEFQSTRKTARDQMRKRIHGTVGAVALDSKGNIAAATSTGGSPNAKAGRIGDSSMIGVGCFANNKTCAISTTGDGEFLIRRVIAHDIAAVMEYKGLPIQKACEFVINEKNAEVEGHMGVIGVDAKGNIGIAYNSPRMHRGWRTSEGPAQVKIFAEEKRAKKNGKK